jgi:hypothetical protein
MQGLSSAARMVFDRADSGEATIIIPAVALAEAVYLAGKGRIDAKVDLIFGIVENALNYRVYPLDSTMSRNLGSWKNCRRFTTSRL